MIRRSLPDYDLGKVEASVPRDMDPMLASQGFRDLLDETRSILECKLAGSGLEIAQLTGAICRDGSVHRPDIWLILCERDAHRGMSAAARQRVRSFAETIRKTPQLS
jgi:hypothetical protein